MFAQATSFSFTSSRAIRRAVSASGKVLNASKVSLGIRQRSRRDRNLSADPATTDHNIAVVADGSLAWRDGFLRLVQFDTCTVIRQRIQRRARAGMRVADLHRHFDWLLEFAAADPVHAI